MPPRVSCDACQTLPSPPSDDADWLSDPISLPKPTVDVLLNCSILPALNQTEVIASQGASFWATPTLHLRLLRSAQSQ